ncbi:MAG: hypothetical protein KJ044_10320, partial [Planctomycetes bacterium]|nr:hypothetical protein [Planctomycetota bacterium]
KLKLKSEDKEAETTIVALSGDTVSFKRGRKDFTARLDDFEPASAWIIKKQFTPDDPRQQLELARFALHRSLCAEARDTVRAAGRADATLEAEAANVVALADILEAERMLDTAAAQIEAGKPAEARAALTAIRTRFAQTPAAIRAEVLLSTLEAVELELRARQLEEEARKAQDAADADERKKRQPIDDWLAGIQDQVKAAEDKKREADADCNAGRTLAGIPKYENVVSTAAKLRKTIEDNRKLLKFRGQPELADRLDQRCRQLMIDAYERWGFRLYQLQRFDVASEVVAKGIALDPTDRRLLALKVDIDELYDPTEK